MAKRVTSKLAVAKNKNPITLAQLTEKYGRNYEEKNLRRMLQFAEQFTVRGTVGNYINQFI